MTSQYSVSTRNTDAQVRDISVNGYQITREILSNVASVVFEGVFSSKRVCIKQYKADAKQNKLKDLIIKEARTLQKLKHANIVSFIGLDLPRMSIVMSYACRVMEGDEINNLRQLIELNDDVLLTHQQQLDIILAVSDGMSYIHSQDVLHLDLKTQNVLVDKDTYQLSDFGISRKALESRITSTTTSVGTSQGRKGTLMYMPPESFKGDKPNKSRDVYSFGMIVYEISDPLKRLPFEDEDGIIAVDEKAIMNGLFPDIKPSVTTFMSDLIKSCLNKDPDSRMAFSEIVLSAKEQRELMKDEFIFDDIPNESLIELDGSVQTVTVSSSQVRPGVVDSLDAGPKPQANLTLQANNSQIRTATDNLSNGNLLQEIADIAKDMLGLEGLRTFQMPVIQDACNRKSVLLVSKCGSGKSVAFTIPALYHHRQSNRCTLVVEPSVNLIQEQVLSLKNKGVDAIALGNAAPATDRLANFTRFSEGILPVLAYCTPEYLSQQLESVKMVDVLSSKIGCIVIDEVHKLLDRRETYRNAYSTLLDVVDRYKLQLFCCSATISKRWLNQLMTRCPQLEQSIQPVKRNHINISFIEYHRGKNDDNTWNWTEVVNFVAERVAGNVTICFLDFQKDAKQVTSDLTENGTPARYLVGANMASSEKRIAAQAFREGEDNVLVATETYECGMHNENTTHVVRVGAARNLAAIIQEMGRVGRNELDGDFVLLFSEFHDDQRLCTWAKSGNKVDLDDPETKNVVDDFCAVWRFIYSRLAGVCSHEALSMLFDDPARESLGTIWTVGKVQGCKCSTCGSHFEVEDIQEHCVCVLTALMALASLEIDVTMNQLVQFLLQNSTKWNKDHAVAFSGLQEFGSALKWESPSKDYVLNIIRICIFYGYISMAYTFLSLGKGLRAIRRIKVSPTGAEYQQSPKSLAIPIYFGKKTGSVAQRKPLKSTKAKTGVQLVMQMLMDNNLWMVFDGDEKKYRLLGFGAESFPFLYHVDNWKTVGHAKTKTFMRDDLQLTKGSGQSFSKLQHEVEIYEEKLLCNIQINKCKGCKKCPVDDCKFGFNNYAKHNECPTHKSAFPSVVQVGVDCPVSFVYVYPVSESDNQQWFGCIGEGHNHPHAVDWRLRSQTKHDLKKAKLVNPFAKPKDFQKGVGMSYEPMMQDPAACHTGRIARVLNKAPVLSCKKMTVVQTIDSFDSVLKEMMQKDEGDSDEDRTTQDEVASMMGRYKVQTAMINDQVFGSFCASWQGAVFSTATHLFMDIVYIRNDEVPGLLNIVAPSQALRSYVPVFRIFLNKQDADAIAFVIKHAFSHINRAFSSFSDGANIEQIMVDFSDAEENGLRQALGNEFIDKVLRGCKFHFMQSVVKVARLVTETDLQKETFIALAKRIPDCKEPDTVREIFSLLGGQNKFADALHLYPAEMHDKIREVKNDQWVGADHWVQWWLRPRHLAKLSAAFSAIEEGNWDSSQGTNNPVESINKTSKTPRSCSLKEAIQHVYHEDKRHALLICAVSAGRSITYQHTPRQKRKRKMGGMGDALNPPDKKKVKKTVPRGAKAVGHVVEIEYEGENGEVTKWHKGRIILYHKSKGYCIRFDEQGPEGDVWEKKMNSTDVRFLS